ncbi:MAG: putative glycoside hydrolase, partial [Fervidobacterium sp.]
VDYICPMVYPSHYAKGSYGLSVPDAYPYEVVYRSVLDGLVRNRLLSSPAKVRPWLQAFTATWVKGHVQYSENEIKKQIKALKDLGIEEYMLWNASNQYVEMKYE